MRKSSGDPENLIVAAGFYNSKCLSDEKIPGGPRESHRRSEILHFRGLSDEKIPGGPENLIPAA